MIRTVCSDSQEDNKNVNPSAAWLKIGMKVFFMSHFEHFQFYFFFFKAVFM